MSALPLEQAIAQNMKVNGFRKKVRSWWISNPVTIGVLNIQKSPYGERLYINLGAYFKEIGGVEYPTEYRCHVRVRLEKIASRKFWDVIASAESMQTPSPELLDAVLNDGLDWLRGVATLEGLREFIESADGKKALVTASIRELVGTL